MDWTHFSNSLEQLGYFRYLRPEQKKKVPHILEKLKRSSYFFSVNVNRDFPADAETLTECDVGDFLRDIQHILRSNNVLISTVKEKCSHDGYQIFINEQEYKIYSSEELQDNSLNLWLLTTKRVFSIVNSLLKEAGSDEQVYAAYGGNELYARFLTPALYNLLKIAGIEAVNELRLYENVD